MINNVTEYLKRSAEVYPDKTAFMDEYGSLTFSELNRQSRALACEINALTGLKTRQPVGVYLPKSVACLTAFFSVAYSGNFYTPLDISMPKARLAKIMDVLRPSVIITDSAHSEEISEVSPDSVTVDIHKARETEADDELLCKIWQTTIDTDPLYVMFTSGSTGMPKGVVISHRSVIDYAEWLAETFSFSEHTVFGNQAPFYFDNSILDIYSTIRNGCKTVIIPEERFLSPKRLCRYLDEAEINTIFWVPSVLVLVANSGILSIASPKKLKQILFCGEVMPTKQLNIWRHAIPNALYANLYGPTEITDVCTYFIVNRDLRDDENLPIGLPCRNTDIIVLNEDNKAVSNGETGELCVRGTCLAHGYYGNADKTNTAFIQNPLNDKYPERIYRTGDLACYNDYGELLYLGRKDYQIKHMGHRIELGEIETAATAYSTTNSCCALYDSEKSQILLAVTPDNIDKSELFQHLKASLPRYMLPTLIEAFPSLPLNPNSKTDRAKIAILIKNKKEK